MEQLSKREIIALEILKAFINNPGIYHRHDFEELAEHSVILGDLLIRSLDENQECDVN